MAMIKCQHCRKQSAVGMHGGCLNCGKVVWTNDGRRVPA